MEKGASFDIPVLPEHYMAALNWREVVEPNPIGFKSYVCGCLMATAIKAALNSPVSVGGGTGGGRDFRFKLDSVGSTLVRQFDNPNSRPDILSSLPKTVKLTITQTWK